MEKLRAISRLVQATILLGATHFITPSVGAASPDTSQQPSQTQFSNQCTIEGSFNYFEIARPEIVGRCLENTHPDPKNPAELMQTTTKGELRQRNGLSYFINGNLTYLLGNRTIYQRANSDTCPGEGQTLVGTSCREIPLQMNHIYTQESAVALTIDDGWSKDAVAAMLEAIVSTGNSATVFINGRYYRAFRDLILQYDQTGKIFFANHTENHKDLGQLAKVGAWGQINSEILNGDPKRNIPELIHSTNFFRDPYFSDNSPNYDTNSELRRRLVFDYGLTIVNSDQGDYDYLNVSQAFIDARVITSQPGQIEYGHFLPRNVPTYRNDLIQLNQRGIRGEDLDTMLTKSLVRTI